MTAELLRWLLTGLITILVVLAWFFFKRWMAQQDDKWEKHDETREGERQGWMTQGGVVTREQYYAWCGVQRTACPACGAFKTLMDWRNGMNDKGGVVTKTEHTILDKEMIKDVTNTLCERIDELFAHHREWVGQELRLLSQSISNARTNMK